MGGTLSRKAKQTMKALDQAAQDAADAIKETADAIDHAAHDAVDAIAEAAHDVVEAVEQAAGAVADAVEEAADAVKEAVEDAADAVMELTLRDSADGSSLHPAGSRVRHEAHGVGTVVEHMDGGLTRVKFDNGEQHTYKPSSLHKLIALEEGEDAASKVTESDALGEASGAKAKGKLPAGPEGRPMLRKRSTVSIQAAEFINCLLYTSPSPRDRQKSRMPSSA